MKYIKHAPGLISELSESDYQSLMAIPEFYTEADGVPELVGQRRRAEIVDEFDAEIIAYEAAKAQTVADNQSAIEAAAISVPKLFIDPSLGMPTGLPTSVLGKTSIVTTSTANASTEQSYSFSAIFLAPPLVFVSVMGDDNEAQEVRAAVKNVTESGCTVCVTRVSGHNNGATESVVVAVMAVGVIGAFPL